MSVLPGPRCLPPGPTSSEPPSPAFAPWSPPSPATTAAAPQPRRRRKQPRSARRDERTTVHGNERRGGPSQPDARRQFCRRATTTLGSGRPSSDQNGGTATRPHHGPNVARGPAPRRSRAVPLVVAPGGAWLPTRERRRRRRLHPCGCHPCRIDPFGSSHP